MYQEQSQDSTSTIKEKLTNDNPNPKVYYKKAIEYFNKALQYPANKNTLLMAAIDTITIALEKIEEGSLTQAAYLSQLAIFLIYKKNSEAAYQKVEQVLKILTSPPFDHLKPEIFLRILKNLVLQGECALNLKDEKRLQAPTDQLQKYLNLGTNYKFHYNPMFDTTLAKFKEQLTKLKTLTAQKITQKQDESTKLDSSLTQNK